MLSLRRTLVFFVLILLIYIAGFLVITPIALMSKGVFQMKILEVDFFLYQRVIDTMEEDRLIITFVRGYRAWWCRKVESCEIVEEADR